MCLIIFFLYFFGTTGKFVGKKKMTSILNKGLY